MGINSIQAMENNNSTNITSQGESNFIWAASHNDFAAVKELADKVNINAKDKRGSTALHWAAFKGHFNIVNFLLSKNAHIDIRDHQRKTPLQWACGHGRYEVAQLLLQYGADPDLLDEKGDSALHWTIFNFHNDIVQLLLDHNTEINCQNNDGITPLNTALIVGNQTAVKLLSDKNAELLSDKQKRNPLHCAVWGDNYECLELIIKKLPLHRAAKLSFINGQDREGETPLHYTKTSGGVSMALLLIQHGADCNIQCYLKERTPLHVLLRNHYGTKIHSESITEYIEKHSKRFTTRQVLSLIAALKTATESALDVTIEDASGLSAYDYLNIIRFDTPQEREQLIDILFNPKANYLQYLTSC